MSAERAARAQQERAQALAAKGHLRAATDLIDSWLAANDGDWGLWLYLATLHARLGRTDQAVAAYCASARQLECDGEHQRAANAVREACRLAPRDRQLAGELARLERLANPEPQTDPHLAIFDILDAEKVTRLSPGSRRRATPRSAA